MDKPEQLASIHAEASRPADHRQEESHNTSQIGYTKRQDNKSTTPNPIRNRFVEDKKIYKNTMHVLGREVKRRRPPPPVGKKKKKAEEREKEEQLPKTQNLYSMYSYPSFISRHPFLPFLIKTPGKRHRYSAAVIEGKTKQNHGSACDEGTYLAVSSSPNVNFLVPPLLLSGLLGLMGRAKRSSSSFAAPVVGVASTLGPRNCT